MPDMRYNVTITANEVMGVTLGTITVRGLKPDPMDKDETLYKRELTLHPQSEMGPQRWVRDLLVEFIEHL